MSCRNSHSRHRMSVQGLLMREKGSFENCGAVLKSTTTTRLRELWRHHSKKQESERMKPMVSWCKGFELWWLSTRFAIIFILFSVQFLLVSNEWFWILRCGKMRQSTQVRLVLLPERRKSKIGSRSNKFINRSPSNVIHFAKELTRYYGFKMSGLCFTTVVDCRTKTKITSCVKDITVLGIGRSTFFPFSYTQVLSLAAEDTISSAHSLRWSKLHFWVHSSK